MDTSYVQPKDNSRELSRSLQERRDNVDGFIDGTFPSDLVSLRKQLKSLGKEVKVPDRLEESMTRFDLSAKIQYKDIDGHALQYEAEDGIMMAEKVYPKAIEE